MSHLPIASQDVSVGIIGMGVRGQHWAESVARSQSCSLGAVVDPVLQSPGLETPVFGSVREAVDEGIDAAIVATPPETHLQIVIGLLSAGIPTLCEKPLSEERSEAETMAALADDTAVPLLVGMNFRYIPAVQDLRRVIASQSYGSPLFSSFTYIRNRDGRRSDLNDYPLAMRQPMLFEQSIHHVDLMRYVYDREATRVRALTWNPATSVYEDSSCVSALIEFEDGLVVNYLGTWTSGSHLFDYRWRTDLERGALFQKDQFGGLEAIEFDAQSTRSAPLFEAAGSAHPIGHGRSKAFSDDTDALLEEFLGAIRGSGAGPTARDHLRTLDLLSSIQESAETGRAVPLTER